MTPIATPDRTSMPTDGSVPSAATETPCWDADRRELRVGRSLVKQFRQPAPNQEAILGAFQEEGWPARIDSPLPGDGHIAAEDRLHEAVKKLNRQVNPLIRFRSDGNARGIIWEFREPPSK